MTECFENSRLFCADLMSLTCHPSQSRLAGCVLPRGMDFLRQDAVQGLRASSHSSAAYFLRQLQVN